MYIGIVMKSCRMTGQVYMPSISSIGSSRNTDITNMHIKAAW